MQCPQRYKIKTLGLYLASCLVFMSAFLPIRPADGKEFSTLSFAKLKNTPGLLSKSFFLMRQFAGLEIKDLTITRAEFEKVMFINASLRNVTFEECVFTNSLWAGGEFRNVTFRNCRFDESQFRGVTFDGVSFTGGTIGMLRVKPGDQDYTRQMFERTAFWNIQNNGSLLLDGVKLRHAEFFSVEGGALTLRNMSDFTYDPEYGRLLKLRNTQVRIENCDIDIAGMDQIAEMELSPGMYITGSTLRGGKIQGERRDAKAPNFYAENSQLLDGFALKWFDTVVLKDCVFRGALNAENVFLVNPRLAPGPKTYPPLPSVTGKKVYIQGDNSEADALYAHGGDELYIAGMRLNTLSVSGKLNALNLYNLKLDNLHFDGGVELNGGAWENVEVIAPMKAASPGVYKFGSVTAYNVTLHGGSNVKDARTGLSGSDRHYTVKINAGTKPQLPKNIAVPTPGKLGIKP